MMVASTVLHSLSSKNEYQYISFPTLLLILVSGANKVCYMCMFMCMHIHRNVIHTNRNYSFTKLFTHPRESERKRKAQESGQPSKSTDEIAAVQKVRRTRNTSKL